MHRCGAIGSSLRCGVLGARIGSPSQRFGLLFQLIAKLAGHGARAAEPSPDRGGNPGQLFGPQHDQRNGEDHQYFGEIDPEHLGV
jgi:hypothetical protein